MDAVSAHKAWLVSHGLTRDEVTTVPVIVRDENSHAQDYSDKQFWSIHIHGSNGRNPSVTRRTMRSSRCTRDTSDIKSAYYICVPNGS